MAISAVGLTTHILNNQAKSVLLLMGFPLLLALMMGGFFFLTDIALQKSVPMAPLDISVNWARAGDAALNGLAHYGHWAVLAAGLWFVVAFFFHAQMINIATGARPVTRDQFPRIYNMLENLCIARGMPMPKFQVIDSPALNAFASGINQKTYAITLTRGIIEALPDDELEGVIAHELTHIINRDVRLLIIAVIFVGMISFFSEMAFRLLIHGGRPNYYARGGNRRNGGFLIMLLIAVLILVIGYVFAIAIRFSLSRRREFLADAGAVEMTKNPDAMMRALLRIAGKDRVAGMPGEVQQMCIENSGAFFGLFATHPPIEARVRVIAEMTQTPVPVPGVTLRRVPKRPWDKDYTGGAA